MCMHALAHRDSPRYFALTGAHHGGSARKAHYSLRETRHSLKVTLAVCHQLISIKHCCCWLLETFAIPNGKLKVEQVANMESPTPDGMSPAPDRTSCLSASATVVNSPNTPQFPPCTAHSDTDSIVESSFSSDEDEDGGDESEHSVQGWPQLAQLMASTPDFAAFPRFRDLNVKSLLYYQCELNILREKLNKLEHRDKAENKSYAEYAEDLIDEGTSSEQFQTMSTIRKTLNAYSKSVNP